MIKKVFFLGLVVSLSGWLVNSDAEATDSKRIERLEKRLEIMEKREKTRYRHRD